MKRLITTWAEIFIVVAQDFILTNIESKFMKIWAKLCSLRLNFKHSRNKVSQPNDPVSNSFNDF